MVATPYVFQKISKNAAASSQMWTTVVHKDSRNWYRKAAASIKRLSDKKIMETGEDRLTKKMNMNSIGRMFMFYYDAKGKKELPYWDKFPLIFPIEMYPDGFLGINLHYLPHIARARLMNALYDTINNNKMDGTSKLKIRYKILKNSSKYGLFKPCIKKYLFSHVRSRYFFIQPSEWDMALMLPLERFQKASKSIVFKDSMAKV